MDIKKPTILICDDSLLVRRKMRDCLTEIGGFNIVEAANGQIAVDMFRQHKPDLVFLDIVMPDKTGIEALNEMKGIEVPSKIIMLSSSGIRAHLKEAMDAGADDFIQKPWDNSQIVHIINNTFK